MRSMLTMGIRALAVLGLSVLSACVSGGGDGDGGRVGCVPEVRYCDAEQPECQAALFEATACLRGQGAGELPPIRTISEATLREELQQMANAEMGTGAGPWDRALRLLRLLPEATTGQQATVDELATAVAAYYSSDTGEVTVIRDAVVDGGEAAASIVLSHEFVHVLQDRAHDLQSLRDRFAGSTDGATALAHVVEGEAVALSAVLGAYAEFGSEDDLDWARYFDSMRAAILEGVERSPTPFVTALQSLAYPIGGEVMVARRKEGGQALLERFYDEGPGATVDWLGADPVAGRGTLAIPDDCLPQAPTDGRYLHGLDSFGATGLVGALVAAGLDGETALVRAAGLRVDAVAVFADGAGDAVGAEWRLRMQDAAAASRLADDLSAGLPGVEATVSGSRVRLIAAEDAELLAALVGRDGCGDEAALMAALPPSADAARLSLPRLSLPRLSLPRLGPHLLRTRLLSRYAR